MRRNKTNLLTSVKDYNTQDLNDFYDFAEQINSIEYIKPYNKPSFYGESLSQDFLLGLINGHLDGAYMFRNVSEPELMEEAYINAMASNLLNDIEMTGQTYTKGGSPVKFS